MESDSDKSQSYILIMPHKRLPTKLKGTGEPSTSQFLVGYRNILTEKVQGKVEWGLVKNQNYCGRAYCFPITENEANTIQQIKQQDEELQILGTTYILLKHSTSIVKPEKTISIQDVEVLLEDIGTVDKISLNLLKSAFDSYCEYKQIIGEALEKKVSEKLNELDMPDRVKVEIHGKKLSGQNLKCVPVISKETGEWSAEKDIPLKFSEN